MTRLRRAIVLAVFASALSHAGVSGPRAGADGGAAAPAAPIVRAVPTVPTHVGAVDADGAPVMGAEIVEVRLAADGTPVYDASSPVIAVTGLLGSVSPLPTPSSVDGRLAIRTAKTAAVLLPAIARPITAVLWGGATIDGSVTTPEGAPATGLAVFATPLPGVSDLAHRTRTDERGGFTLSNLSPGAYRLRVVKTDGSVRELGTVTAPSVLLPISLKRGAILKGRVFDGDAAKPVAGVRVVLHPMEAVRGPVVPEPGSDEAPGPATTWLVRADPEAETGPDGRLLFADVLPGVYEATVATPGVTFDGEPPRVEVAAPRLVRLETWWVMRRVAVKGRVLTADRKPIPDASVLLSVLPGKMPPRGGWAPTEPTRTNADGSFVVAGVAPSGDYRLLATAAGFAPGVLAPVVVGRGSDTDVKWVVLKEPWTIEATVKDPDGKPVSGARVTAAPETRPDPDPEDFVSRGMVQSAATDALGLARVGDLGDGDAILTVSKPGFVDATLVVPHPVGRKVRAQKVSLARTASIEGRVTVGVGAIQPAALAQVSIRAVGRRSGIERSATPKPDGSFRIDDLPPVPTDVEALPTDTTSRLVLARRESVMPGSGEPVVLEIPARGTVSGDLTGIVREGGPVVVRLESARFDAERDAFRWEIATEAAVAPHGDTGSFSFPGIPPGAYALRGVQGLRDTGPVPVRVEGKDVAVPALELPAAARIEGVVYDAATRAARLGARVFLVRLQGDGDAPVPSGGAATGAVVGDHGVFAFEGVAPGLWRVEAIDGDLPPVAEVVRVNEGETVRVPDLRVSPGGRIAGSVRDEDGRGLAGAAVRVFALPGLEERPKAVTADDGAFGTVALAAGRYRLKAGRDSPGFARAPALEADVDVVEGETTKIDLGAAGRGRIEGVVRRRGHGVAGVGVEAVIERRRAAGAADEAFVLRATTGEDGRFRWDALGPGRYTLLLEDGTVRSGAVIDLAEGDHVLRDLELEEGRIVGRVVTSLDEPVVGAEIVVGPSAGCTCDAVGRTRTAPDGRFVLAGLPLGAYRIEVAPPSLPSRFVDPVVAESPGLDHPIEVVIGTGASLDLHVTDFGRRGVTAAEVWIESLAGTALHRRAFYTGPSGNLHVDGLPEGAARVVVHAKGYGRPAPRAVALKEGVPSSLEVVLRPATSLLLTVTAGRDPVARARVDLFRSGSDVPVERRRTLGRTGNEWGITPRTGVLLVVDLEEGDYVVVVNAGSLFEEVRRPVRVRGTAPTEVQVDLPFRGR